jgi:excisionase family DNA binding protein
MTDQKQSKMATAEEVASELRLHVVTVRKLMKTGKLPGTKFGTAWRMPRRMLDALTERGTTDSAEA